MDFSVLSRYDDMLANYFVDSLYLWFKTIRMNTDFVGTTVEEQKVIKVIREELVGNASVPIGIKDAAATFLEFPYFKDFVRNLSKRQATEFAQHLRRYLFMYAHNAGFEVSSTKRYTGKMEACIVATKNWKAGEQVKYCLGSIAELSEEDDAKLKREGRDFSVMVSTRKKCSCLFLGPARFMNHDCDANCEFLLIGHNAITFKVHRDIACGQEMTVYYADHYFGENNCECRCSSCERLQQGGFSVKPTESEESPDTPESTDVVGETTNTRRSHRKRKEISYKDYIVPPQTKRVRQNSDGQQESSSPLTEITNTSPVLNERKEPLKIDEKIEEEQTVKRDARQIEMNLSFICNDKQENGYWVNPRKYEHNNSKEELDYNSTTTDDPYQLRQDQSPNGFCNKLSVDDEGMTYFFNWLDIQSDLSDDNDNNSAVIEANCCFNSKDFAKLKTEEGKTLCARCYRHYMIYGTRWPLRKKKKYAKTGRRPKPTSRINTKKPVASNVETPIDRLALECDSSSEQPLLLPRPSPILASPKETDDTTKRKNKPRAYKKRKQRQPGIDASSSSVGDTRFIPTNTQNDKVIYPICINVTKEELLSIPTITNTYDPSHQNGRECLLASQRAFDKPIQGSEARLNEEFNYIKARLKNLINRRRDLQELKIKYQLLYNHQIQLLNGSKKNQFLPNAHGVSCSVTLSDSQIDFELELDSHLEPQLQPQVEPVREHRLEPQVESVQEPESVLRQDLPSESQPKHQLESEQDIQLHVKEQNQLDSREECLPPPLTDSFIDAPDEPQINHHLDSILTIEPVSMQKKAKASSDLDLVETPVEQEKYSVLNRWNSVAVAHEPTVIIKSSPLNLRKTKSLPPPTTLGNSIAISSRAFKATTPPAASPCYKTTISPVTQNNEPSMPLLIVHGSKSIDGHTTSSMTQATSAERHNFVPKSVKSSQNYHKQAPRNETNSVTKVSISTKPSIDVDDKIAQALARKNQRYLEKQKALSKETSSSKDGNNTLPSTNHFDIQSMPIDPVHIPLIDIVTPKKISAASSSSGRSMSATTALSEKSVLDRKKGHTRKPLFKPHHPGQSNRAAVPISIPTTGTTTGNRRRYTAISSLVRFSRSAPTN